MPTLQRPDLDFMFNGEFLELSILNQLPSPQLFLLLVWMWTDLFTCAVSMLSCGVFPLRIYEARMATFAWHGNSLESVPSSWTTEKPDSCFPEKLLGNLLANWNGISIIFGQTVLAPNIFQDIILEKKRKMVGDKDAQSCLTHLPFPLDSFERGTQEW